MSLTEIMNHWAFWPGVCVFGALLVYRLILKPIWHNIKNWWNPEKPTKPVKRMRTINPLMWNFIVRPILSITAAVAVVLGMELVLELLFKSSKVLDDNIGLLVTALFSILIVWNDQEEPEKVPDTKMGAVITLFGMPIRAARTTGTYSWTGKHLGLDRTRKSVKPFTDDDGFVFLGDVPFPVWDHADADKATRTIINAPAKNRAEIKGTLTLILDPINPLLALNSADPALDLGDRARQEFREVATRFVDTDLAALQEKVGDLMKGVAAVTAFLTRAITGHKEGAMVRDDSNEPIIELVAKDSDLDTTKGMVKSKLSKRGMKKMLRAAVQDDSDEIAVDVIQVSQPVTEVIDKIGYRLKRATFGDIILSAPVQNAANQASSEVDQHTTAVKTARAEKAARLERLPSDEELANPGYELAAMAAAAGEARGGNVKLILSPGDTGLGKFAAALSVLKGDKNDG